MLETLKQYSPVAVLALVSRILLTFWPVEVVDTSQSALLNWPIFLTIVILGYPAVHFAEKLRGSSSEVEKSLRMSIISKAFIGGVALSFLLIGWDITFVLPRDMNVVGLASIPFYIAGAFLVEILQHAFPLTIWFAVVGLLIFRGKYQDGVFWAGLLVVAAFEPMTLFSGSFFSGYPAAFFVVGFLITYGINLVQLYTFKRRGFVPMFVLRLGLYALWHVIWGLVRLQALF